MASKLLIPNLRQQISDVYEAGIKTGDVKFTPTERKTRDEGRVCFEIRLAEALDNKPMPKDSSKPPADPFAPPYKPNSLCAEYSDVEEDEHFVILLNKFCVTKRHFLLCTKDFSPQDLPPTPSELYTSFRILQQFDRPSEGKPAEPHAAFFNCGKASGASQPHKHLQFVAMYDGTVPFEAEIEDARPAHYRPGQFWQMPQDVMPAFHAIADTAQVASLTPSDGKRYLSMNLLALMDAAFDNLRRMEPAEEEQRLPGHSRMSYNLIITTRYMLLATRSKSDYTFSDGTTLSLNALGFAGMILTKNREQFNRITDELDIRQILLEVGFPRAELDKGIMDEVEEAA